MTVTALLASFGAGIFGAAIGALTAFEIVGFLVIIGVAIQMSTSGDTTLLGFSFGVFGPHVGGFASGVAAAAYAAAKGKLKTGRDIGSGMMGLGHPDVLLVGGIFGVAGYLINFGLCKLLPPLGPGLACTDTVALTVVISAIIARLMWGKTGLFGKPDAGQSFYSPAIERRWLPFASEPGQLLVIGVGVGLMGGFLGLTYGTAGVLLSFGISAASLLFLQLGIQIPVTHHLALPAAIAAAASGSLICAGVVGIICAFGGEFFARTFLVYGDTHIDPPACTIAAATLVVNLLTAMNFWTMAAIPY